MKFVYINQLMMSDEEGSGEARRWSEGMEVEDEEGMEGLPDAASLLVHARPWFSSSPPVEGQTPSLVQPPDSLDPSFCSSDRIMHT